MATVQPTGFDRFNEFTTMVRIEVHFNLKGDWFDHRRDSWFDRTVRCRGQGSHLASFQPPHPTIPSGTRLQLSPPMLSANHKKHPPSQTPTHHDLQWVSTFPPSTPRVWKSVPVSTLPILLIFSSLPAIYSKF